MMKQFRTISSASEVELIINRSRFIARAYPAESEPAALARLEEIRKQHYDASHNCYAYRIGEMGSTARFSDDGEPGGTAGLPMMEVLTKRGVTNLIVVVTRYFGGILLGAGGLVRAYSAAAADAVSAAQTVDMIPGLELRFTVEYPRFGALEGFIREKTEVREIAYTEIVTVAAAVAEQDAAAFIAEIVERSDGRVKPEITGECYMRVILDAEL